MDLNLEKMKRDVLGYLETSEFAVFHSVTHGLEGLPAVFWDVERNPDYRAFLDVARKAGVKIILFASAEFDAAELDDLEAQIEETDLDRDEQRDLKSRLRVLRAKEGAICTLELAFDYNSRLYVFEVQPDWYDEFVSLEDEIMDHASESDLDDSLGGYFSKN